MIRHTARGVAFYQFANLSACPHLQHAVFTRLGGVSRGPFASLNVGHWVGDDPQAVDANERLAFGTLGVAPECVVTAQQVHGAHVARVGVPESGHAVPETDGLVTNARGLALLLRFADCLPVLLYDPVRHALGLVHSGWRGTLAGVLPNAITEMHAAFGCDPADILACLGPAIGAACYAVGPDVATHVRGVFPDSHGLLLSEVDGGLHLDLAAAVHKQLEGAGVRQVEESGICTHCRTDEFFSHRGEGGHTGRFAVMLALAGEE